MGFVLAPGFRAELLCFLPPCWTAGLGIYRKRQKHDKVDILQQRHIMEASQIPVCLTAYSGKQQIKPQRYTWLAIMSGVTGMTPWSLHYTYNDNYVLYIEVTLTMIIDEITASKWARD